MIFEPIFKKTKKGKIEKWEIEVVGNAYRTISGEIGGKKTVTKWTYCTGKNVGKKNGTTDEQQALFVANSLRQKRLEHGSFEKIEDIDNVQYFQPMLAFKWDDVKEKITYPVLSQPKVDGIRCIVSCSGMRSRNGKEIVSAPHILSALKASLGDNFTEVFDGDLYNHELHDNFNEIVSLVKKTKPTEEDLVKSKEFVQYHIYDLPSEKSPCLKRLKELQELLETKPTAGCVLVPTVELKSEQDVENQLQVYLESNYEGQILRTVDGLYDNSRSKNLLKHKVFLDEEFLIVDVIEGVGNLEGKVGKMKFVLPSGKTFTAGLKCTHSESEQIWTSRESYIGKKATVKFFNYTPDGIPRFPKVINIDRSKYE